MTSLSETSPEAERVLLGAYRAMSTARKWALLGDLYRMARALHATGVRLRNPGATSAEVRDHWIATQAGDLPRSTSRETSDMDQPIDNLRIVREVLGAFDSLGVTYALGGALASGIHGIIRYTSEAEILIEPFEGLDQRLPGLFGPDYDLSQDAIRQALRDRSSFTIINTAVGFKAVVIVVEDRWFHRSLMARRVFATMEDQPDRPMAIVRAEDSILLKLDGEVSDGQWADVLGILKVQAGRLDEAYLDDWSIELDVADLLADARLEAGL